MNELYLAVLQHLQLNIYRMLFLFHNSEPIKEKLFIQSLTHDSLENSPIYYVGLHMAILRHQKPARVPLMCLLDQRSERVAATHTYNVYSSKGQGRKTSVSNM